MQLIFPKADFERGEIGLFRNRTFATCALDVRVADEADVWETEIATTHGTKNTPNNGKRL